MEENAVRENKGLLYSWNTMHGTIRYTHSWTVADSCRRRERIFHLARHAIRMVSPTRERDNDGGNYRCVAVNGQIKRERWKRGRERERE